MSLYVEWLNKIKEQSTVEWLTHSQRRVYDSIINDYLGLPFVNLYGSQGVGKSFLARILSKEHGYFYTQNLETIEPNLKHVIVDNVTYSRLLRPIIQIKNIERIIFITTKPIYDPMPFLELSLDDKDLRQFLHNLYEYCNIEIVATQPDGTDFSKVIRDELIALEEKIWDSKS